MTRPTASSSWLRSSVASGPGATSWRLCRETGRPDEFVESFIVGTWEEHERQHQRVYPRDEVVLDQLDATLDRPRQVEHFIAVRAPAHATHGES